MPSKTAAALLAIIFGTFGVHHFYLKNYNVAIVWLLIFLFTALTVVGPLILGAIGFIQGLSYLFYSDENWRQKYGQRA